MTDSCSELLTLSAIAKTRRLHRR